jgi:hypothetical protein
MGRFDSGVKRYIKARAVVEVGFPVDWRDNPDISCKQCPFFERAKSRCNLTMDVVNFPDRYVGETCPLERVEEENEVNENV